MHISLDRANEEAYQLILDCTPGNTPEEKLAKLAQFRRTMERMLKGKPIAKAKMEELRAFTNRISLKTLVLLSDSGCVNNDLRAQPLIDLSDRPGFFATSS